MSRATDYFLLFFMLILTVLYCCFMYLGMGLYMNLLQGQGIKVFSGFTAITSTRPLLWQILAVASLVLNVLFGVFSSRKQGASNPFVTAAALHISWLLICSLLNGIGSLLPFFMWVPVLE